MALFAISAMGAAQPGGQAPPTDPANTIASRRIRSVKDSPGYVPLVDPESMSVVVGRRRNAPAVHKQFQGGSRSLDELGRTVCRQLRANRMDSLMTLCVRDDEFRDILWREFPQSRPAVGLTWEDAWKILWARMHAGCSHAVRDYGGQPFEFVRFRVDSTAHYRNFKLYSHLRLLARDEQGTVHEWSWLRAVAERKGRFKIYSTDD